MIFIYPLWFRVALCESSYLFDRPAHTVLQADGWRFRVLVSVVVVVDGARWTGCPIAGTLLQIETFGSWVGNLGTGSVIVDNSICSESNMKLSLSIDRYNSLYLRLRVYGSSTQNSIECPWSLVGCFLKAKCNINEKYSRQGNSEGIGKNTNYEMHLSRRLGQWL